MTEPTSASWDDFLGVAKDFIGHLESQFKNPDDDWDHFLFIEAKAREAQAVLSGQEGVDEFIHGEITDETSGLVIMPLPLPPDSDGAEWAIGMVLTLLGASRVAIVTSVWALETKKGERPPVVKNAPGSYEAVHLIAFDSDVHHVLEARIHRSNDLPPMLSEWKEHDGAETELTVALQKRLK